jgi:lipopolysaccharide export LptBFGC system permease protein LptF
MSRPRHWLDHVVDVLRFDRLDRYVVRYFFGSVLVVFVFFFGFFMVIDLFANADEFVETAQEKGIGARRMLVWVAGYYLYKAPSVFLQVAPFVTVIGGIVAIARMNRFNEIVPVLMSGRSVFRMLRPMFVCAAGLMGFMLLVQELLAPAASDKRLAYYSFLRRGTTAAEIGASVSDPGGWTLTGLRFDALQSVLRSGSATRVVGERIETIDLEDARFVELAEPGRPPRQGWTMEGGVPLITHEGASRRERTLDLFETSVTPRQITARAKEPFDLSFAELGFLYGLTRQARFQVLLHYHVTFPLTNLLLLLLAVPFVLRYDRQHVMQGLAIAFFLCVAYFGVDSALRTLGEHKLHPVLAAWFAPLFFGALGISLFDGVRT